MCFQEKKHLKSIFLKNNKRFYHYLSINHLERQVIENHNLSPLDYPMKSKLKNKPSIKADVYLL